jgi:hypothetical protein
MKFLHVIVDKGYVRKLRNMHAVGRRPETEGDCTGLLGNL